ncbi:GAD-like domain-containing protein [Enemella evansiae]|uniref:GAD-like domain-containing protein n=1 Tax=Enemella evansiae TaxID=2016499 RepID=UPI00105D34D0|nr:GAD-like domain-containing protein [Enemella evansiae]TDO91879.1 hypothetical protein C8D81_2191 [Enemella evansiae]
MEPFLEEFLVEMGPVIPSAPATPEKIEAWRGTMPELILTWWEEVGFAGFADGLLWLTDPDDWTDLAADFIPISQVIPSSLESVAQDGPYFPWLRTAFGEMYCWSPTHGAALNISPVFRQVGGYDYTRDIADGLPDTGLEEVLLADRDEFDMRAEDGKPLFRRLLKRLGPVASDTMYALTPAAVVGGPVIEQNFSIEPAEAQLAVLASL